MKTTLVIMAAGIGSRFGGGIKQLEQVGPHGEILMDYAIKDGLTAGFNKIIFIIRKDLEEDFKAIIGHRIEPLADVSYAFQELDDLPGGFTPPLGRKKPWGTGQALLACKDLLTDPFVVINADDYYGQEAFQKVHDYLTRTTLEKDKFGLCLAGFILKNTLSENGGVTRGICTVDEHDNLTKVMETRNLIKTPSGAAIREPDGRILPIDENSLVSMNMWGSTPAFLSVLESGFLDFLSLQGPEDLTAEYILPEIIDKLIQSGQAKVKLLYTSDRWFGVTYKEDKPVVINALQQLIAQGIYG